MKASPPICWRCSAGGQRTLQWCREEFL